MVTLPLRRCSPLPKSKSLANAFFGNCARKGAALLQKRKGVFTFEKPMSGTEHHLPKQIAPESDRHPRVRKAKQTMRWRAGFAKSRYFAIPASNRRAGYQ